MPAPARAQSMTHDQVHGRGGIKVSQMWPFAIICCSSQNSRKMLSGSIDHLLARQRFFWALALLLSLFMFSTPSNALLKLQEDNLVENAKPDWVYLVEFPRIVTTPSHTMSLLAETWMAWKGIRVHRISNRLLIGSKSQGTVPFAQFNGKYIDGTEAILKELKGEEGILKKRERDDPEALHVYNEKDEAVIRKLVYEKLYMILMVDRITRNSDHKGGADFTVYNDAAIPEHMMPALSFLMSNFLKGKPEELTGTKQPYSFKPSVSFWKAYFDAANGLIAKETFLRGHVDDKLRTSDWKDFNEGMKKFIEGKVGYIFLSGPSPTELKVKQFLDTKTLDNEKIVVVRKEKEGDKLVINLNEKQLFDIFLKELDEKREFLKKSSSILERLESGKEFLFGNKPSSADAALFAILVMWFQRPEVLNFPMFRQFFTPGKHTKTFKDRKAQILYNYMEKVKRSLGFDDKRWNKLVERPWPLNYEEVAKHKDKYDGPYKIITDKSPIFQQIFVNGTPKNIVEKARAFVDKKTGVEKEDEVLQILLKRLLQFINVNWAVKIEPAKLILPAPGQKEIMLLEAAGYICGFGKDGKLDEKCREKFTKNAKANECPIKNFQYETRKIVYQAIVDYNDGLVDAKLIRNIGMALKVGAGGSSSAKDGNEL